MTLISGQMYYWRIKPDLRATDRAWRFGYCTHVPGHSDLVRMGFWNGDTAHGPIVSSHEIETRFYYA